MMKFNTADEFFAAQECWSDELYELRDILKSTELVETLKWGMPVYTVENKNVVGIGAFKSYFGIWFYQGVFLKDPEKVLVNAQEGKTKAMRQWRMESSAEIDKKMILKYVDEAIENQKAGKELKPEKGKLLIPGELNEVLKDDKSLRTAFSALTPGKQREYANYVSEAKMEKTRLSRVEKIVPMIKEGIGLNDRYK